MLSLTQIALGMEKVVGEPSATISPNMKKILSPKKKVPQVSSTLALARLLGLSEWTVSRAINGHPEVKAATRERILKAMDEVGFRPSPVARGLSGKAMGIVGVSYGMARNPVMMEKIAFLDEFLRENNLQSVLAICPPDEASQISILQDFKHLRVDGVVLVQSYISAPELQKLLVGMRCVHVDNAYDLGPRVWLDRGQALRMTIDHLWELGHRSFATIGFSSSDQWRWVGIPAAISARGGNVSDCVRSFELPNRGMESYGEGIELAGMVLEAPQRPTAVIAINDQVAAGAIQGFIDRGLRVPQDLSLVGFGNFHVGQYLRPRLTTIDQRPEPMMRLAGEMLLSQLGKGGQPAADRVIEPLLIVRESTGPAPSIRPSK